MKYLYRQLNDKHHQRCSPLIGVLLLWLGVLPLVQANSLSGASNMALLNAACPKVWEHFDRAITPKEDSPKPTAVPWENETDRQKQIEFQRNFIIPQTKPGSRDTDSVSRDVITVLSECLKRHNYVVRDEFNKTIGELPDLIELPVEAVLLITQYLLDRTRDRPRRQYAEVPWVHEPDLDPLTDTDIAAAVLVVTQYLKNRHKRPFTDIAAAVLIVTQYLKNRHKRPF